MTEALLSRPRFLRYLGLFGAVCCAIDAFLFGAGPTIRTLVNPGSILRGSNGPLIMLLWVVGLAALCTAWWHGRGLAERGALTLRWILGTAALWSAPMLIVPPLASRDMYANSCQGALFDAGFNPSIVGVSAQPCPWLDTVSVLWRDTPTPYGPVFIVLAGAAAAFGSQLVAIVVFRLLAVLGVVAMAVGLPVLARRVGVPSERALWLVLCCPLVPVHLIGGGHNDAITMAFLVGGLAVLAAPSKRADGVAPGGLVVGGPVVGGPAWGGVAPGGLVVGGALLGLAVAVKPTIGVVLPFAALLAAGGLPTGGWPRLLRRGGTVIAVALGVLAATSLASGLGFGWLTALSGAGRGINWTSPPTAVGLALTMGASWVGVQSILVEPARIVALVVLVIALPVVWWRSRQRDPLVGAGLALLVVIFLAPIVQPWYLIWPATLFAASNARARWLAVTIVCSMALILPEGSPALRPRSAPLAFAMLIVIGLVIWRAVRWLRGAEIASYPPVASGQSDRVASTT